MNTTSPFKVPNMTVSNVPTVTADPAAAQKQDLINILMRAPATISHWRRELDEIDAGYQKHIAAVSLRALTVPLFPGKTDADPKRFASNEKERDIAIQLEMADDYDMKQLALNRANAVRFLQEEQNRFEAAKIAAQLLTR